MCVLCATACTSSFSEEGVSMGGQFSPPTMQVPLRWSDLAAGFVLAYICALLLKDFQLCFPSLFFSGVKKGRNVVVRACNSSAGG